MNILLVNPEGAQHDLCSEILLSANQDISRELQFQSGRSPLISVFGFQGFSWNHMANWIVRTGENPLLETPLLGDEKAAKTALGHPFFNHELPLS
jgi:hypothetical protein